MRHIEKGRVFTRRFVSGRIFNSLLLALLVPAAAPALAQGTDPAIATVQDFYNALTAAMKMGGPAKARYDKLRPAVERAFDIPGMTALSVGPSWSGMNVADRKTLTDAFERMTVANYASNFDSYHGEKFSVDPAVSQRGTDKFVKSDLKPASGDTVPFNYRLHQADGAWKIVDVYLNGNISQLAQKRSDFSATLAVSGPQGLAKKIDALADQALQ